VKKTALASNNATLTARNSAFLSAYDSVVRTMNIGTQRIFRCIFSEFFSEFTPPDFLRISLTFHLIFP
jgi:hypothetical protein